MDKDSKGESRKYSHQEGEREYSQDESESHFMYHHGGRFSTGRWGKEEHAKFIEGIFP